MHHKKWCFFALKRSPAWSWKEPSQCSAYGLFIELEIHNSGCTVLNLYCFTTAYVHDCHHVLLSQCWWGCSNYSSWKFDLRGCSSWKFWLGILKLSWNALQCNTMPLSSFTTCNFWMTRYRNKLTENRYASNQTISTVSWNLMSTLNFTNLINTNSRPCKCFFFSLLVWAQYILP